MKCRGHINKMTYCPYEDSCNAEKIDVSTCKDSLLGNYIASATEYCRRDDGMDQKLKEVPHVSIERKCNREPVEEYITTSLQDNVLEQYFRQQRVLTTKAEENETEFIFTTILPYTESYYEKTLKKETLREMVDYYSKYLMGVWKDDFEVFEDLFIHENDYKEFFKTFDTVMHQGYNLYDITAKYGAKEVVKKFRAWKGE